MKTAAAGKQGDSKVAGRLIKAGGGRRYRSEQNWGRFQDFILGYCEAAELKNFGGFCEVTTNRTRRANKLMFSLKELLLIQGGGGWGGGGA